MAVINWPAQHLISDIDIWIFQYQELANPAMSASRKAYLQAGKQVWGYHCISPTASEYLNSFVDVPVAKSRLIPWLASQSGLSGWLYWFINWGWQHRERQFESVAGKGAKGSLSEARRSVGAP